MHCRSPDTSPGAEPDPVNAIGNAHENDPGNASPDPVSGSGLEFQPVERIVQGCLSGHRRAHTALFLRYRDRMHGLAYRALGPSFDIDDVVQQIFLRVFRSLNNFKGLSSLDTWVYRIGVKVCTDQLRSKYRKRKIDLVSDEQTIESGHDPGSGPGQELETKEIENEVRRALDKLGTEKRLAVILFELEGKSLEEIARIMNRPSGTIKSRLFHARKELKRYLRKYVEA